MVPALQFRRALIVNGSVGEIACVPAAEAVEEVSLEQLGVQFYCTSQERHGLFRTTACVERHALGRMAVGQAGRQLQSPAAVGEYVFIRYIEIATDPGEGIAVGYSRIGSGVSRIELHSLSEQSARSSQILLVAP